MAFCCRGIRPSRGLIKIVCAAVWLAVASFSHAHAESKKSAWITENLQAGLENIEKLYLDTVSIPDLSIAGLQGLSGIDARLAVQREGKSVRMTMNGVVFASFFASRENDIAGWANLVTDGAMVAQEVSPILRGSGYQTIINAIFKALLDELDPYSRYIGARVAKDNRALRDGFGGVGVRVTTEGRGARIRRIIAGGPASFVGLRRDDLILRIDGNPLAARSHNEVTAMLRGRINSFLRLVVERESVLEPITIDLRRQLVVLPTAFLYVTNHIAVIQIVGFNQGSAILVSNLIKQAFNQSGLRLRGFILDVRSNPGGLLDQAIKIADLFLSSGTIISANGRHKESRQYYRADPSDHARGLPMVVLIDDHSASAAEIITTALQENGRAIVVGTRSFGKGTVQTVVRMPNDGEMILTWARLITPLGQSFDQIGVTPEICISRRYRDTDKAIQESIALLRDRRNGLYCPPPSRNDRGLALKIAQTLITRADLFREVRSLTAPRAGAANLSMRSPVSKWMAEIDGKPIPPSDSVQ